MSTDVNYYSFSFSRADKKWPHFVEDVAVLRKKYSTWDKHEKDMQELQTKEAEIEASFESRINEMRKKIFDFFDKKEYVIPGVEWNEEYGRDKFGDIFHMTDEEKMEYLELYGCVYPRATIPENKNTPYLMLEIDAPHLKESYDQIIDERNKAIKQLIKQATIAPMDDKSVKLNKRQEELDANLDISYLVYEKTFDKSQLFFDLKNLDMYYGSVFNRYFENPKSEYSCLEALIEVYNLKTEDDVPTRDEWIRLFQNISAEKIEEMGRLLANEFGWDQEEAEWEIKDYLRSVRPVVKDLQETQDAFFIRMYGGEIEVEPKNAELMLIERAKKHATKYKGLLRPVL